MARTAVPDRTSRGSSASAAAAFPGLVRDARRALLEGDHAGLEASQHRLRVQPQPQQHQDHRREDERLARGQVGEPPAVAVRSLERAADEAQGVERRNQDADRGEDRERDALPVRAQKDQELAHEVGEPRQAERPQREEEGDAAQGGGGRPQPAHPVHVARVQALLEQPRHREEGAGADPVRHHGHERPLEGEVVPGEDAEQHEAEVGDARVRHQALEVVLAEREQAAVEDADHGQGHRHRGEAGRRLREQRHHEAQHAVRPRLQQQPGQDHAAGRGRLGVGVGQPGVERHHRQLHRERDEEAQHDPQRRPRRERGSQQLLVLVGVDARRLVVEEVQGEDGDQHQEAAHLREDEELHGRVEAPLVPPDGDQEVHGHEHQLPGEVEEEEVHRQEDAGDPRQHPEQVQVEEAHAFLDLRPGDEDGDGAQEEGQQQEEEAQPVERPCPPRRESSP
jgi:hypothetical protein